MNNIFSLTDQVAIVTGASSGLGRHFAHTLAKAGAKIAVCARRVSRLQSLVEEIQAFGGTAMAFSMDVTDHKGLVAAIDQIESDLGIIDILINNAGTTVTKKIVDFNIKDFDLVMDTNLKGSWLVAQEVGRAMISSKKGGVIINISSLSGHHTIPGLGVYGMSKAGVSSMTRYMAQEWARHNIRVNAIAPGYIETELNSQFFASKKGKKFLAGFLKKRLGKPSDLDGVLLLLASGASDFITGAVFDVDDGSSLVI